MTLFDSKTASTPAKQQSQKRRRGPTLKGTIRIAKECGFMISSIDMLPDGTRRLHFGTPASLPPQPQTAETAFDKWKAGKK